MVNTGGDLQLQTLQAWMDAIRWAIAHPDQVPVKEEVSEATFKARMTFCETLRTALTDLIEAQGGDEDALLYLLVSAGQMIGIRAALDNNSDEDAVRICIRAGNHMIAACMATRAMQTKQEVERREKAAETGTVH